MVERRSLVRLVLPVRRVIGTAALAAVLAGGNVVEAQDRPPQPPRIVLSAGDTAKVKVGPEFSGAGDTRFPDRSDVGEQGLVVAWRNSPVPVRSLVVDRPPAPPLADLIGRPDRQAALDRSARPGDWVTPPAARR